MVTEQAMHQMALRGLAGLRFLELEAEARAKAEQAEKDALLTEAFTLWKSTHPEPMAQWEFEILVNDEEREKWLSIARAARSLHVK
jgi:hypothetical protein